MQRRTIMSGGKRLLVNVATDDGVGAGFAVGQMVLKSYGDNRWYIVTASGSNGSVVPFVSQSALPFVQSGSAYQQYDNRITSASAVTFFEQNFPYQIVAATDGKAYQVYLTGTAPTATLTVSQSAFYNNAYFTSSLGAIIDRAKPYLLLQNITDGNYFMIFVTNSGGTIALATSQSIISASWVHPIF